jgi:hypothetical protein
MKVNCIIHLFLGTCLIYGVAGFWDHEGNETVVGVAQGARQVADMDHRYPLSNKQKFTLQRIWWNWNFCTSAFYRQDFTPMNSLVPADIVFLAGFSSVGPDVNGEPTCADPLTRTGTISAGRQTLFFPIFNSPTATDLNDDFRLGRSGCSTSKAEATYARFSVAYGRHLQMVNQNFSALLYAQLDGDPLTPFYLIEDAVPHLKQCPDKRTTQEYNILEGTPDGELCDARPFTKWGGLDYGPLHGWWGSVTRRWEKGSVHTVEFGGVPATFEFGGVNVTTNCISAKYVLTVD